MLTVPAFGGGVLLLADAATLPTPEQADSWRMGQADLKLDFDPETRGFQLPPGSRTVSILTGRTIINTQRGLSTAGYIAVDSTDALTEGLLVVRGGRSPRAADEVAISRALSHRLGMGIGEVVEAGMPLRELTVVGVIDEAAGLRRDRLVVPLQSPVSAGPQESVLVDLPDSALGWRPPSDGVTRPAQPEPAEQARRLAAITLVVGFGAAQVMLLVGAAFAVTARRQRRDLAVLAAVGASPRQVSRVVLLKGVVLGAAAGALGVGLALVTFTASSGLLERLADHPLSHDGVPWSRIVAPPLLAVALGGLAASGPAHRIHQRSITPGLSLREVAGARITRRLTKVGIPAAALGAAATIYAVNRTPAGSGFEAVDFALAAFGAGLVLIGLAALGPGLVLAAGRFAGVAMLPARLALRHATRHRVRTGAAVAAVCAATAGSVGIALFLAADVSTVSDRTNARPGQVLVAAAASSVLTEADLSQLADTLPTREVIRVEVANDTAAAMARAAIQPGRPPRDPPQHVAVGGEEVLRAVTGRPASASERAVLTNGGAVAFYPEFVDGETVSLAVGESEPTTVAGTVAPVTALYSELPGAVVSAETARQLATDAVVDGILVDVTRMPTSEELDQALHVVLRAQLRAGADSPVELIVGRPPPDSAATTSPMVYVLALISALVTLLACGLAVGLASAEMRDDMSTLAAVGGGRWIRRLAATCQAGLVVGLGVLLGTVAGFAPAAGLFAFRPDVSWNVPWLGLAIAVVAAPLVAMMGAMAFTGSKLELVRRVP